MRLLFSAWCLMPKLGVGMHLLMHWNRRTEWLGGMGSMGQDASCSLVILREDSLQIDVRGWDAIDALDRCNETKRGLQAMKQGNTKCDAWCLCPHVSNPNNIMVCKKIITQRPHRNNVAAKAVCSQTDPSIERLQIQSGNLAT